MVRLSVSMVLLTLVAASGCGHGSNQGKPVRVSSFGYDPEDSTAILQRAIDSGVTTLVLDRQARPWITRPLRGRSNLELVFEDGVELVAKRGEFRVRRGDCLLSLAGVTNVVLRGLGQTGGVLRMWKRDYTDPKLGYVKSEWRHALSILGSSDIRVENMRFLSSGGDGIVIGRDGDRFARHVTIRRCVCDDNHRQGISICSGEDILIEDTELSNTKGTPPQAGIDLEPNNPDEPLARIVLRNVVSKGNAGNGFETYLQQMNDRSPPVSIRFENCRSFGNRRGVYFCASDFGDEKVVKGLVEYVGCEFNAPTLQGIMVSGAPAGAVDVAFRDCTVRDAKFDVFFGAGHFRQGPPDGLAFENLTIYRKDRRPWFNRGRLSYGPKARNIRGNVTVVTPEGREKTSIDSAWIDRFQPEESGGRMPVPRVGFPFGNTCRAIERMPGESVALSPVALVRGGRYLLFVSRPGPVTLEGRCLGEPDAASTIYLSELQDDGEKGRTFAFETPGEKSGRISFKASKAGFCRLTVPDNGRPFVLERSTVPVAVDVCQEERIFKAVGGRPYALWFDMPKDVRVSFCAGGDACNHFAVTVSDASGTKRTESGLVTGLFEARVAADAATTGLWRADFSPVEGHPFNWVRADVSGIPGVLFLSPEKHWTWTESEEGGKRK